MGANRTISPEKLSVLSKASKKRRLNDPPEARTGKILCKPTKEQNQRLITGLSAVYSRDEERSFFLGCRTVEQRLFVSVIPFYATHVRECFRKYDGSLFSGLTFVYQANSSVCTLSCAISLGCFAGLSDPTRLWYVRFLDSTSIFFVLMQIWRQFWRPRHLLRAFVPPSSSFIGVCASVLSGPDLALNLFRLTP